VSYKLPADILEDDVYQWLNDGWVRHPDYGVIQFLGDVNTYDEVASFFTLDEEQISAHYADVTCEWPICGMVNHNRFGARAAVYVRRNQRRQWRRTFNQMCCSTTIIGRWGVSRRVSAGRLRQFTSFNSGLVRELFDPTYYGAALAMRMIQAGEAVSLAITPQVAICGDGKHNFTVYYRERVVGGITNGKYTPVVVGKVAEIAERLVKEALDEYP
jgi:hypothetical protein